VTTYRVSLSTLRGEPVAAWLCDTEAGALADARLSCTVGYGPHDAGQLLASIVRVDAAGSPERHWSEPLGRCDWSADRPCRCPAQSLPGEAVVS
jgi:hypothetical protein